LLIVSDVCPILACNLAATPYPPDVAAWLGVIGDELHEKMAGVGLIPARRFRLLDDFLESYKEERTDWKKATRESFENARKRLIAYFGNVPLRDVTAEAAALYRSHLVKRKYREGSISK
jgi:hypothetical protein